MSCSGWWLQDCQEVTHAEQKSIFRSASNKEPTALRWEQKSQQSTRQNGVRAKPWSQSFNMFCHDNQEGVQQINLIFLKLLIAGHQHHKPIFFCMCPRFPPLVRAPVSPQSFCCLLTHPHTLAVAISAPCFSLVLQPLPHLPARSAGFSDASRKPKLLSPLVDCYDGSKRSRMDRKMFHLPCVGRMRNLGSTGFTSGLWEVVCYSNCRLFRLLYRLFIYPANNS